MRTTHMSFFSSAPQLVLALTYTRKSESPEGLQGGTEKSYHSKEREALDESSIPLPSR